MEPLQPDAVRGRRGSTRRQILEFLMHSPNSTASEIAEGLGLNEPTVHAQLARARQDEHINIERSDDRPYRYRLKPPTLHEEIREVLLDSDNGQMTAAEIARAVNKRGRYRRRDREEVPPNQIHARVKNYPQLFEKVGKQVRLVDALPPNAAG